MPCLRQGQVTLAHEEHGAAGRAGGRQKVSVEGFEGPGELRGGVTGAPGGRAPPRTCPHGPRRATGPTGPTADALGLCALSGREGGRANSGSWPHPGNNWLSTALGIAKATSGAQGCVANATSGAQGSVKNATSGAQGCALPPQERPGIWPPGPATFHPRLHGAARQARPFDMVDESRHFMIFQKRLFLI